MHRKLTRPFPKVLLCREVSSPAAGGWRTSTPGAVDPSNSSCSSSSLPSTHPSSTQAEIVPPSGCSFHGGFLLRSHLQTLSGSFLPSTQVQCHFLAGTSLSLCVWCACVCIHACMHTRMLLGTLPQESPALFLRNRACHWDLGLKE